MKQAILFSLLPLLLYFDFSTMPNDAYINNIGSQIKIKIGHISHYAHFLNLHHGFHQNSSWGQPGRINHIEVRSGRTRSAVESASYHGMVFVCAAHYK